MADSKPNVVEAEVKPVTKSADNPKQAESTSSSATNAASTSSTPKSAVSSEPAPAATPSAPAAKKSNSTPWIVGGIGCVVLLILCCASYFVMTAIAKKNQDKVTQSIIDDIAGDSGSTSGEKSVKANMNEEKSFNGLKITVFEVEDPYVQPANEIFTPDDGQKYVAVRAKVVGDSSSLEYYSSLSWDLYDTDGNKYSYTLLGNKEPVLDSGSLNMGDMAEGWMTFEIPSGATPSQIVYAPFTLDGSKLVVDLK